MGLIRLVEAGKFLEAIQEYYAENATMQENDAPPRRGLAALLENERKVLASVKDMRGRADSFLVDVDRAAINWVFEYVDASGVRRRLNEVAYQQWRDGAIIAEKFYYDPAQRRAEI